MMNTNKSKIIELEKVLLKEGINPSKEDLKNLKDNFLFNLISSKIENEEFNQIKSDLDYYKLLNIQKEKLESWNIDYKFCERKNVNIKKPSDFIDKLRERFSWTCDEIKKKKKSENLVSINRLNLKKDKGTVEFICIVQSINKTKNKNYILTVEDFTGEIKILINKNKTELYKKAESIFEDDIFYVKGGVGDNIVFVNEFEYLDYKKKEVKINRNKDIVFISDLHIGSDLFCEKEFLKFINWINIKDEKQAKLHSSNLIKYLIITGDLVDGVGIFQDQNKELVLDSIKSQYDKAAELLGKIRKDINIIITPGNHESVSLVEPQSIYDENMASEIYKLKNTAVLPNPSNIYLRDNENKLNILLYHGYSFDYYVANNDKVRKDGGYERIDLLMDKMLERRSLSNTFKSNLLNPMNSEYSIIKEIPNIFVTGHFHRVNVSKKKGVYLMNAGCWQKTTKFQEKFGHVPDPCKAILFNILSKKVKIMNFND